LHKYGTGKTVHQLKNIKHFCLDLDGTLYLGSRLFDFTLPFLATLGELGIGHTFFTNNSSRSTRQYIEKLNKLGIDATEQDLFSSTHCTFDYLRDKHPAAKRAFILGTPALREEFVEHGYVSTKDDPDDEPDLVVVGFDPMLAFERVCRAAWWLRKGKPFIATHPDRTCPTDQPTVLVDCGSVCRMLVHATGREPDAVMGKPNPRMLAGVMRRHNLRPDQLATVGDRLSTDVAMARGAGAMGILVLSGEATARQAKAADPPPDFVVENVGVLAERLRQSRKAS
jgi:HAD superfamily hydrolase (TIGR01450 family)